MVGRRIYSVCGIVVTKKNWKRRQVCVLIEVKDKWTIFLIINELVLLENLHFRDFVGGKN